MYLNELQIGDVKLRNNILLAPMAGITDLPFRLISRQYGAGYACTEMVSAKAIFYDDEKTKKLMNSEGEPKPLAVQIFGSDIEALSYTAKYVSNIADIIDINMGCPAPKVTKNGEGSKILMDLELAEKIMRCVVQNSKIPVTIKYRKGWDNDHIVAVEVAKIAEKTGVSAITLHGRTRTDFYSGKADWEIIKKVKQSVHIPVIGNGDIVDEESAKEMFEKTGVDGIMIGRASLGNPWIFQRIVHYLKTGEKLPNNTNREKLEVIKKHLELIIKEKGETIAIKEFRKHIAAYTKNMQNSSSFRVRINSLETKKEVEEEINKYFA